jgi:uncharacterized protein with HEPN domain
MPPRDARKYLYDITAAAAQLSEFVSGRTLDDYLGNRLLQAGVERQFEIVGEALSQLSKLDPALAKRISDYQKIISFRNILIHGYADVDDELVWDIVETSLPILRREIAEDHRREIGSVNMTNTRLRPEGNDTSRSLP